MGHILQSTPDMGEYEAEVRRESFYLYGHKICLYPDQSDDRHGTIEIDYKDIPKLRAALDLVDEKRKQP
jgi:hypothetical protein